MINTGSNMAISLARPFARSLAALALGMSAIGASGGAGAADPAGPATLRILTSPSGSGPYNAFATIQTHMEQFSKSLRLNVVETPGFNYNVKYISRNKGKFSDTIFGTGSVLNWAAINGQKPFYPVPIKALEEFRIVAVMGLTYNVWATVDEDIKTPRDFVGKRVGTGLLTQNEWGMHQRMLLDAWGLTPRLATLDTLGTDANIDAMLDGRTDVATLFGLTSADGGTTVVTGPHRQLEASGRAWKYVNVPRDMIDSYVKDTGAPFRVVEYEPGVLPKQPQKLVTFGDLLLLQAHKSVPDALVEEFVRVLVMNYEQIGNYNAFTRAWSPATLAYTADEQPEAFHPGALKAFRAAGLLE